jgi:hypothetical protein
MMRTMTHPGGERKRIASCLLLVVLASNLFHSHLHGCVLWNIETRPSAQKILPAPSVEGNGSTYYKILPCLACNCQKQKIAVLSAQALLAKLVRTEYCSIEPIQCFKKQPFLPIDLSRAPPSLG